MSRYLKPLVLAAVAVSVFGTARVAEACWCRRVFTRFYCDPCVSCPTVVRSYAVPVAVCPTTSCSTTNVERCYYEPQTVYETRNVMVPQTSFVRRSYYDPLTCCYRAYLEPMTQYVERSYQVPITTHVKRCATEPVTTCTTSYAPANGAAYLIPEVRVSSYWFPDGYRYYPVYTTVPAVSCPVPVSNGSNGSTTRGSGYGPSDNSKKTNGSNSEPPNAPPPTPMPEKREGGTSPSAQRNGWRPVPASSRTRSTLLPTGLAPTTTRQFVRTSR